MILLFFIKSDKIKSNVTVDILLHGSYTNSSSPLLLDEWNNQQMMTHTIKHTIKRNINPSWVSLQISGKSLQNNLRNERGAWIVREKHVYGDITRISKISRKDKRTITLVECQNLVSRTLVWKSKQNCI